MLFRVPVRNKIKGQRGKKHEKTQENLRMEKKGAFYVKNNQ